MKLSRVDRIQRTFQVADLFPDLDPASVTGVSFALLAPRSESPTAATVWTAYTVSSGAVTVLFVGPEADSTGGLVVPATADAWAKASGSFGEVEAVKIPDRITVAGAGQLTAQVVISANALIGLDTDGTPYFNPSGIGTPASLALDTDSVLYYTAP